MTTAQISTGGFTSCDAFAPEHPELAALSSNTHTSHADLRRGLAPLPLIDRFPIVQGSQITLSYLASVSRLALQGQRQLFVDLLDELLDYEPHATAVMSKRVQTIAGARVEVTPADIHGKEERAREIADFVRAELDAIPFRVDAFSNLLWGIFYGISALEIYWRRQEARWRLERLGYIHSRRLSFPNYGSWELCIWDQGQVYGWDDRFKEARTEGTFGLRISDFPNKFLVHAPRMRAQYPTREGLGRVMASYILIKRMIMRVSAQDFERFVKPWVIAYYATTSVQTKLPRQATKEDKDDGFDALKKMGAGSMSGAMLPDSIKIDLLKSASELDRDKFLEYLDGGITKLAAGNTFTTEPGKYGSKGSQEQGKQEQLELARFDAKNVDESLREGLIKPLVRLNFPDDLDLCPIVKLHVERVDPDKIIERASKLAGLNAPVDGRATAQEAGVHLIHPDDEDPIRLVPVAPVKLVRGEMGGLVVAPNTPAIGEARLPPGVDPEDVADPNAPPTKGETPPAGAEDEPEKPEVPAPKPDDEEDDQKEDAEA